MTRSAAEDGLGHEVGERRRVAERRVEAGAGVTHAAVLEQFAANLPVVRELLVATVAALPIQQADCVCGKVYADTPPTFELP